MGIPAVRFDPIDDIAHPQPELIHSLFAPSHAVLQEIRANIETARTAVLLCRHILWGRYWERPNSEPILLAQRTKEGQLPTTIFDLTDMICCFSKGSRNTSGPSPNCLRPKVDLDQMPGDPAGYQH